jgi:simple sugar transport system permease protein
VLAAIFFGTLQQAGLAINQHVPKDAMDVLTACAIVVVAVANRAMERSRAARTGAAPAAPAPTTRTSPATPAEVSS